MIKSELRKFRLTGTTPLLGADPMDKEVYTKYLVEKCKTEEEKERAKEDVKNIEDVLEEKTTGFFKEDGMPIITAHQIKGFIKEAARCLKDQFDLKSAVSKIDNYVFILERYIPLYRDGERITKPDGFLERPLRAQTAQGPRVSLAKSEKIDAGWTIEFTVQVIENKKTAQSVALTMDLVEQLFEYGELKGLLQWRNAGYGSFTTEVIE